jgi:hypothetical protein
MPRTRLAVAVFFFASLAFALLFSSPMALAQPFKAEPDASTAAEAGAPDAALPAPAWPRAPEPSATTTSSSAPRPDPGPGLRERGGRTRRANPASGVLLVIVIVAALGWYVVKRIRRF